MPSPCIEAAMDGFTAKYSALSQGSRQELRSEREDPVRGIQRRVSSSNPSRRVVIYLHVLSLGIVMAVGILIGRYTRQDNSLAFGPSPRNISISFQYNKTFASEPSKLSNAAWNSLLPDGAGFFQHPELAVEPSAFSVFHQLHCLNLLRLGYYDACRSQAEQHDEGNDRMAHHLRPAHVRHCFDFLRQAIMCAADTNIEPVDAHVQGITGWGDHICRDYDAVVRWTAEWKSGFNEGIL